MLVTLITVDGRGYVGHPNGPSSWTTNIEAAGWVEVDPSGPSGPRYAVAPLTPGPERDAVIRATWTQQPFPANLLYRAARRHVAAVGIYYRLDPIVADAPSTAAAHGDHARRRSHMSRFWHGFADMHTVARSEVVIREARASG